MTALILGVLGLGVGFLSGLLGIGGGVLYVPALVFILGVPIQQAIAISLAVIVPSAFAGMLKLHLSQGVDFGSALILAPLAIVGAVIGAHFGTILPALALKRIFGCLLIIVGINAVFGLTDGVKALGERDQKGGGISAHSTTNVTPSVEESLGEDENRNP